MFHPAEPYRQESCGLCTPDSPTAGHDQERAGGLGFDKESVQLALGEPDRLITRTDASGTKEIWSYTTYEGADGAFLYRGWYHRYYCYGDPFYPYYLNFPSRRTRERFRVVFSGDKVIEVQQEH